MDGYNFDASHSSHCAFVHVSKPIASTSAHNSDMEAGEEGLELGTLDINTSAETGGNELARRNGAILAGEESG